MIRSLLKDSAVYGVSGAASRAVSAILAIALVRYLAREDYGRLDVLQSLLMIITVVVTLGVPSGVARSYFEALQEGHRERLAGAGLSIGIVSWLASALVLAPMVYFGGSGVWRVEEVVAVFASVLPTVMLAYLLLFFRLDKRPRAFAVVAVGSVITTTVIVLICVIGLGFGVAAVFWTICASKGVWAVVAARMQPFRVLPRLDWFYTKAILAFGVPLVPTAFAHWAQLHSNRFFIVGALGSSAVAVFGFAAQISLIATLANEAFQNAWLPRLIEGLQNDETRKNSARVFDLYIVAMFTLAATAGAAGPLIVHLVARPSYAEAGHLIAFLMCGTTWLGTAPILGVGTSAMRKTYLNLVPWGIGAGLNLLLLWLGLERFGLFAAGVAYLAGSLTVALTTLAISTRLYPIAFRPRMLILAAVSSILLPFALLVTPAAGSFAATIALRLLVAVVWSAALVLFGLNKPEKEKLMRILRKIIPAHARS